MSGLIPNKSSAKQCRKKLLKVESADRPFFFNFYVLAILYKTKKENTNKQKTYYIFYLHTNKPIRINKPTKWHEHRIICLVFLKFRNFS